MKGEATRCHERGMQLRGNAAESFSKARLESGDNIYAWRRTWLSRRNVRGFPTARPRRIATAGKGKGGIKGFSLARCASDAKDGKDMIKVNGRAEWRKKEQSAWRVYRRGQGMEAGLTSDVIRREIAQYASQGTIRERPFSRDENWEYNINDAFQRSKWLRRGKGSERQGLWAEKSRILNSDTRHSFFTIWLFSWSFLLLLIIFISTLRTWNCFFRVKYSLFLRWMVSNVYFISRVLVHSILIDLIKILFLFPVNGMAFGKSWI